MKKSIGKVLFTMLMTALVMTVFAVGASAAEVTQTWDKNTTEFTVSDGDVILIDGTVTLTEMIEISQKTVVIKGKSDDDVADVIIASDDFPNDKNSMIKVRSSGNLALSNVTLNANRWIDDDQDGTYEQNGSTAIVDTSIRPLMLSATSAVCTMNSAVVTGGYITNGGGVYLCGTLTMNGDSKIAYNGSSGSGAGIFTEAGTTNSIITLNDNSAVGYNQSGKHGGGIYSVGTVKINGGSISNNTAASDGGGIYSTGTVEINSGSISVNTSTGNGGGIYSSGTVEINGGSVSNNTTSEGSGGGIATTGSDAKVIITAGTVSGNSAEKSGKYGGGIMLNGSLTMSGGTVSGNDSSFGGGIYNQGTVTMSGGSVTDNTGRSAVGGISMPAAGAAVIVSGSAAVNDNWQGSGSSKTEANIRLQSNDTFTVEDDHTGEIGITLNLTLDINSGTKYTFGTAAEGVTRCNITSDNQGFDPVTDISGTSLQFGTDTVTFIFKNLDDETKEYEILSADDAKYILPEAADCGVAFTGQFIGYTDGTSVYSPGAELTNSDINGKTFTVAALDISTEAGASIKLGTPGGIRFLTKIDTQSLGKLVDLGFSYQRGIKIGTASDNMTAKLLEEEAVKSTDFDTWKGSLYYKAEDKNGMSYSTLAEGYSAYSVALTMTENEYEVGYYFSGYIVLSLGGNEYTLESDFRETDHCRSAKYVADAYGSYLKANGTWNENTYEGLTAEQYQVLCTIAGAAYAPDAQ